MKLIAYTRSSDRMEREDSHEAQEAKIREWARSAGHKIAFVISEPSGTRGTTADRVGWADALNALQAGKADGIAVRELERLARDVLIQEQLLRDVWDLGADVFSTAPSEADIKDDPEDPTRRLIRVIIGAVHAHNRDMTVLRLLRGKRRKAQAGRYTGGLVVYGHRAEDKERVPDPGEQAGIKRIRELDAAGLSSRAIADTLNAEQIPAKQGGPWHSTTVLRVLARLAFAEDARAGA